MPKALELTSATPTERRNADAPPRTKPLEEMWTRRMPARGRGERLERGAARRFAAPAEEMMTRIWPLLIHAVLTISRRPRRTRPCSNVELRRLGTSRGMRLQMARRRFAATWRRSPLDLHCIDRRTTSWAGTSRNRPSTVPKAGRGLASDATHARAAQPAARLSLDATVHTVGACHGPSATLLRVALVYALTLVVA